MQHKQVLIATDDTACFATNSQLEDLVVLRITAFAHMLRDLDQFCLSKQHSEKFEALILSQVPGQVSTAQNSVELINRLYRNEEFALSNRFIERMT
jgi:hypothetical protein